MSTTHASIIELLRATTMSQHRALERTPLMASLMDKDLSVAGYAQVLLVFARFYATLDPVLIAATRHCAGLPDSYRYQPRLPYLQRDLAALGERLNNTLDWQPATLEELFAATQDRSLLNGAKEQRLTKEQILGLIYVVEGSSQGGKIIAPRLVKQLQLTNNHGLSFFHYFAFQATAWPALREMLFTLPADGLVANQRAQMIFRPQQVCDAACTLFQALTVLTAPPKTLSGKVICI